MMCWLKVHRLVPGYVNRCYYYDAVGMKAANCKCISFIVLVRLHLQLGGEHVGIANVSPWSLAPACPDWQDNVRGDVCPLDGEES
jgi:hypothetical protein